MKKVSAVLLLSIFSVFVSSDGSHNPTGIEHGFVLGVKAIRENPTGIEHGFIFGVAASRENPTSKEINELAR